MLEGKQAAEPARKVEPGEDLIPGCWYRITEIDPLDPDPSLQVGDIVQCAAGRVRCIDPESTVDDQMRSEWLADFAENEGVYRTLVVGVEEVPPPDGKS